MNSVFPRFAHPRGVVLVLAMVALAVAVTHTRPAGALEPGPSGTAAATQDGWWNRLQGPQEEEPEDNPIRPLLPAVPAAPTVPGDAIAAGASAGQVDKVAAVGIDVALPPGGLVDSLTLHLKEAPGNGANVNSDGAKVVACPATAAWGPAKNAAWRDRPEADCDLGQAEGVRAEDGTWTFDLTAFGIQWTDPFAAMPPHGVVLSVDAAASPEVTQVSWLDFDTGNVVVELEASVVPGPISSSPGGFEAPPPAAEAAAPTPEEVAPLEVPAVPVDPGPVFSDPLAFPTGGPTFTGGSPAPNVPEPPAPESPTTDAAVPQPSPQAGTVRARPVGFWDNIPIPTILLLPVVLGLALLAGLALGPGGRPQPVWPRAGGLSRALARRTPGEGDGVV